MSSLLVAGLVNLETTVAIPGFPLPYNPVLYPFNGVASRVSGVAYNIAKALTTLGTSAPLLALIGNDPPATLVYQAATAAGLTTDYILPMLSATPQSAILYDPTGRRQIHVDLKDAQEQQYPIAKAEALLAACEIAVLGTISYTRPLLQRARQLGKWIATDVHTIASLDDDYSREYLQAAHILFLSDEHLPSAPEEFAQALAARYPAEIIVIGLGGQGALLYVRADQFLARFPAQVTRPVVNTIGAGDSLFAAFLHTYHLTRNPYIALRYAIVFASYKIGTGGAAEGFLTAPQLAEWVAKLDPGD